MHVPDLLSPSIRPDFAPSFGFPENNAKDGNIYTYSRTSQPFTTRDIEGDEVLTSKSWLCIGCGRECYVRGTRTLTVNQNVKVD
jgi:hypothetical protein